MSRLAAFALLLTSAPSPGADLAAIDRTIAREPAYATKSPRYALLALGPGARDRVWLVKDGDTLHVDRNGDGDLTGKGERLSPKQGGSPEDGYEYVVGELTVNGRTHHDLNVRIEPLRRWAFLDYARRPELQSSLRKDPAAEALTVSLNVDAPHLKAKGRVFVQAGVFDINGPLTLAASAADAPIIHFAGPLEITFWSARPRLKRERPTDVVTVVGTPGVGAGTFAMLGYDETIPESARPKLAVTFPPPKPGEAPPRALYELKERC